MLISFVNADKFSRRSVMSSMREYFPERGINRLELPALGRESSKVPCWSNLVFGIEVVVENIVKVRSYGAYPSLIGAVLDDSNMCDGQCQGGPVYSIQHS
jgi:hypothetical protein